MLKAIKRIIKNLKWLFNHPCVGVTEITPEEMKKCDYCDNNAHWQTPFINFCFVCLKKTMDEILCQKK